ncbi:MAG: sulfatase [Planctomycetota bacterium]|nr:sulfatase [Planctomycetota bacterium]
MRLPSFLRRLTVGALLPVVLVSCSDPEPKRTSVILITLDTLRADYLSCYGSSLVETPHLDSLAKDGVRYALAQSASAVTPVSHATILTGRLPYEHGLRVLAGGGGFRLDPSQPSLGQAFKKAGYRTGAIQSAFPVSRTFGLEAGFDVFQDLDGTFAGGKKGVPATWDVNSLQRRSDATTDLALEFIDSSEEPFFLWIHYWDPHDDMLLPPEEYMAQQPATAPSGVPLLQDDTALYAVEVEYQDTQIGRLFDGLRTRGLMQDLLIAATSDHGEGLADGFKRHGWFHHRMTYQEQIHVPMLIAGPGVPSGLTHPHMVSTADLAPTLLELAGLPASTGGGRSLMPLTTSTRAQPENWAYSDQVNAFDWNAGLIYKRPDCAFLYTISDGDWKLTYRPHLPFDQSELFHLTLDPKEKHNKISSQPEVFRKLAENLAGRNPWVLEPFNGEAMDEGSQAALSNIGYGHLQASGTLKWWWECALHAGTQHPSRGRCDTTVGDKACGFPLLPRTDWKAPER